MASQIAHIIYAQKYFKNHPMPPGEEDEFMLGCVFPDIRRIDEKIKRKDSHLCYDSCDLNFSGLSPFRAGWKFHTYCDMKREEILNGHDFYKIKGTESFCGQVAKQLEDELLYEHWNNWEKLVYYFNHVPAPETGVNVSRETFQLWYAILAKYIEKKPDSKAMRIFLSKQSPFATKVDGIMKAVDKLRENKKAVEILNKVVAEIV